MTIQKIQKEIIDEFKNFDNWMDKYNYLIKLGKNLPSIDSKYKIEENLIKDCQVRTWFYSTLKDGKVFYGVDSRSIITKGIAVLLIRTLSGQKPEDIKKVDLYFIKKIGLRKNFFSFYKDNLWKLVNQMKQDAILYKTKIERK